MLWRRRVVLVLFGVASVWGLFADECGRLGDPQDGRLWPTLASLVLAILLVHDAWRGER